MARSSTGRDATGRGLRRPEGPFPLVRGRVGHAPQRVTQISHGFTLIEILIALAVFAVVSSSLLGNASRTIDATATLRDKTIAQWIATNEINKLRVNNRTEEQYPRPGRTIADVRLAEIDWLVDIDVEDTENQDVRRVTVHVSRNVDRGDAAPVLSYVSFIGRY